MGADGADEARRAVLKAGVAGVGAALVPGFARRGRTRLRGRPA